MLVIKLIRRLVSTKRQFPANTVNVMESADCSRFVPIFETGSESFDESKDFCFVVYVGCNKIIIRRHSD